MRQHSRKKERIKLLRKATKKHSAVKKADIFLKLQCHTKQTGNSILLTQSTHRITQNSNFTIINWMPNGFLHLRNKHINETSSRHRSSWASMCSEALENLWLLHIGGVGCRKILASMDYTSWRSKLITASLPFSTTLTPRKGGQKLEKQRKWAKSVSSNSQTRVNQQESFCNQHKHTLSELYCIQMMTLSNYHVHT